MCVCICLYVYACLYIVYLGLCMFYAHTCVCECPSVVCCVFLVQACVCQFAYVLCVCVRVYLCVYTSMNERECSCCNQLLLSLRPPRLRLYAHQLRLHTGKVEEHDQLIMSNCGSTDWFLWGWKGCAGPAILSGRRRGCCSAGEGWRSTGTRSQRARTGRPVVATASTTQPRL